MINSVLNEGVRGLQLSSRELQRAAHDIARANIRPNEADTPEERVTPPSEQSVLAPLEESRESTHQGDIIEPLIELRRQEHLFNASAKVISVADNLLGSLIDVKS